MSQPKVLTKDALLKSELTPLELGDGIVFIRQPTASQVIEFTRTRTDSESGGDAMTEIMGLVVKLIVDADGEPILDAESITKLPIKTFAKIAAAVTSFINAEADILGNPKGESAAILPTDSPSASPAS